MLSVFFVKIHPSNMVSFGFSFLKSIPLKLQLTKWPLLTLKSFIFKFLKDTFDILILELIIILSPFVPKIAPNSPTFSNDTGQIVHLDKSATSKSTAASPSTAWR